jgi:hypothetical protein
VPCDALLMLRSLSSADSHHVWRCGREACGRGYSRAHGRGFFQYRMHPAIARFPCAHFYHNRLLNAPCTVNRVPLWPSDPLAAPDPWLQPYCFIDVCSGTDSSGGRPCPSGWRAKLPQSISNAAEARMVVRLLVHWQRERGLDVSRDAVVITFYAAQVRRCLVEGKGWVRQDAPLEGRLEPCTSLTQLHGERR